MNFEELGPTWRKQNDGKQNDGLAGSNANVLSGVIRRAERDRLKNLLLGIVGFAASLLVVQMFSDWILHAPNMFVRIGAAMCVLGALGGVQINAYALWPNRSTGQSTCDYFSQELRRNEKLIASNKSFYMWALMAFLTVGACLVAYGRLPAPRVALVIALALTVNIVAWWGARSNVRHAEQLQCDIKELLAEFEPAL